MGIDTPPAALDEQHPGHWALYYAQVGWRVFPVHSMQANGHCSCGRDDCGSPAKHPQTKNGLNDASSQVATVQGWWRRFPSANIGVATGQRSGFIVLDVDNQHGGMSSLNELCARYGVLPETRYALTGGGGVHFLFRHPGGDIIIGNKTNLAGLRGLDVRGDGGYIVAAPSVHASGNRYEWGDRDAPLSEIPGWLGKLLIKAPSVEPSSITRSTVLDPQAGPETAEFWLRYYLERAGEGSRNDTGLLLARQLRDTARLSEDEAAAYMARYAEGVPGGGYSAREALQTLKSAYSRPAGTPAHSLTYTPRSPDLDPVALLRGSVAGHATTYTPRAPYLTYDAAALPDGDFTDATGSQDTDYTALLNEMDAPRTAQHTAPHSASIASDPAAQARQAGSLPGNGQETHEQRRTASPTAPDPTTEPKTSKAPKASRFHLYTDAEVEALPPPEWLVHGLLQDGALSIVYGAYGSAKSFLVLDWGLSVATGTPWLGRKVKQGCVVYAAGEGLKGIGKRIRAWKAFHGVSIDTDYPFRIVDSVPQLLHPEDLADFVNALRTLPEPPKMVILDTLSRCLLGKDENNQKDMTLAMGAADHISRAFGCHVLIVHHAGKDGKLRGSTVSPAGVETILEVTRDGKSICVANTKQKDEEEDGLIQLTLHKVALDETAGVTSCVLSKNVGPGIKPLSADDRKRQVLLTSLQKHPIGLSYADWEREAGQVGIAKSSFDYHRKALVRDGLVLQTGGLYAVNASAVAALSASPSGPESPATPEPF